jgi:hypothetical protein
MCDGYIVYQGEAKKSSIYFEKIGFQIPTFANPSDYFMKRLTINYPKTDIDQ